MLNNYIELSVRQKIEYSDEQLPERRMDVVRTWFSDCPHVGSVKTPYKLCCDIIEKLPDLNDQSVLVWFNPEFAVAISNYYPQAKITLATGSLKAIEAHEKYGFPINKISYIHPHEFDMLNRKLRRELMQFDVVIGNPPYQASDGKSASHKQLWPKFVKKSIELCKDGGYISLIHPSPWRKPDHKPLPFEIFKALNLLYIEIHNQRDGQKTFGAATRYDWYVVQKSPYRGKTTIKDENSQQRVINLKDWDYLPNKEFELFSSLLAKDDEEKCDVIYSRSAYGADKPHTNKTKYDTFQYPCVYMMTQKTPLELVYSKLNDRGHFDIPKVIVNIQGATLCCLNDFDGEYGMTQWVFGIVISSYEEGEQVIRALKSEKFRCVWEATKWLAMTREWKIFRSFRKDFWKDFV